MKRKEITMTIAEFMDYTEKSKFERFFKSKEFKGLVTISLAIGLTLLNSTIAFAGQPNLSGIDRMGSIFLHIIQTAGYWICLVMGIVSVLKEITKGGDNFGNIGKVILKYVISFASLYMLPYFFEIVKECFK